MTRKGARDEFVKQLSDWEVGGKSGVRKDTETGQVKHFIVTKIGTWKIRKGGTGMPYAPNHHAPMRSNKPWIYARIRDYQFPFVGNIV